MGAQAAARVEPDVDDGVVAARLEHVADAVHRIVDTVVFHLDDGRPSPGVRQDRVLEELSDSLRLGTRLAGLADGRPEQ